jgi:hypothetical protein
VLFFEAASKTRGRRGRRLYVRNASARQSTNYLDRSRPEGLTISPAGHAHPACAKAVFASLGHALLIAPRLDHDPIQLHRIMV